MKTALSLQKEKSFLNGTLKLGLILFYIGINIFIRALDIELLFNISMILGAILIIFIFAISSKKIILKNVKLIAKIVSKKFPKPIYDEKIIAVKNDEVIFTVGESSFTTKLYDIKEIIVDENIIALISSYDKLCAFVPWSVFKDEKEKEEFLQVVNKKINKEFHSEEEMDYTYEITAKDYANYLIVNGIKTYKKINTFGLIFLAIIIIFYTLYFTYNVGIQSGATFMLSCTIIYLIYFYFSKPNKLDNRMIRASHKYFKKHPELLNTQQIKVEKDSLIHCINGIKKKFDIKSIKQVHLKNDTIIVFGSYNQLYCIVPCDVFSSEYERDNFISLLNKC